MRQKIQLFIGAALLISVLIACQKEEPTTTATNAPAVNDQSMPYGKMQLGKQLQNPYSTANMQQALDNLKATTSNGEFDNIDITTTHLYLQFQPQTEEELSILLRDSTLKLYDYPLDYEIIKKGTHYRDPAVAEGQPTYQYAAVKVGEELSKELTYKVLAELFIPDEYKGTENAQLMGPIQSEEIVEALVNEALRITDNLPKDNSAQDQVAGNRASSWRPAGRIRVWDDYNSVYLGLQGVEVRANRWFTTHTGIANSSGYYSCNGTFRNDANYSIKWERYQFMIRDGWQSGANYNGPKKRGDWNLNIRNGAQEFYGTIFRAAYHYYYKSIKGLRRPPQNGTLNTQMKIRAYNEENPDANGNHSDERRFLGIGSQIKIFNPQNSSRSIYATTIHELAHASHWNLQRNDFDPSETRVKESWARGVQWELTRMTYPGYRGGATIRPNYTQLVVDMIDRPSDYNNGSENTSQDNVQDYTIRQIEDALQGQRTWHAWRNNIRNRYNNSTEGNLNTLFDYWD